MSVRDVLTRISHNPFIFPFSSTQSRYLSLRFLVSTRIAALDSRSPIAGYSVGTIVTCCLPLPVASESKPMSMLLDFRTLFAGQKGFRNYGLPDRFIAFEKIGAFRYLSIIQLLQQPCIRDLRYLFMTTITFN